MTSLNAIEVWFSGFERSKGSADLLNIYHLSQPSICGIQVRQQTAKYNASWYITAVAADVRSRTFSQALVETGFPDFPWLELFTQRQFSFTKETVSLELSVLFKLDIWPCASQ